MTIEEGHDPALICQECGIVDVVHVAACRADCACKYGRALAARLVEATDELSDAIEAAADREERPWEKAEQVPVRTRVAKWAYGHCKRCLENGVKDGDVVVKIAGKGWWHDDCFRVVRPSYYRGIGK